MAAKIYDYYLKAGEIGGIKARTKLSMLTKITSGQANSIDDTEANIKIFEEAMKLILKEFGDGKATASTANKAVEGNTSVGSGDLTNYLRKHIAIFSDLTAQRSLFIGDLSSTCKRITESVVDAINVERSSIWLYDENKTLIKCEDLFIRSGKEHQDGFSLYSKDFPNYFASLTVERTLAANDAHKDPRTKEFSEVYLKPLGINSMLDVPIWIDGKMMGVICNEHVGPARKWTTDEESFAYLMAGIVASAIEAQKPQAVLV